VKTLLYGIGNISRQDDAVGIWCAERLESWSQELGLDNVDVDATYQLQIEDSAKVAEYDRVLFLDASVLPIRDVLCERLEPAMDATHTTHSVSPACVLGLCRELYGRTPEAYAVHIRGHAFELGSPVTGSALANLDRAVAFVQELLSTPSATVSSRRTA
jgi:hydrogenase maturation protease